MIKAVFFDADGVLTVPEEFFSVVYAKSHGLDPESFRPFFTKQWSDIVTGKKDLKESIIQNQELWQWSGTPDELVAYWCKSEDIRNTEMIDLVKQVREAGTHCFLVTEQEKYRGEYMKNIMFKDLFDGYFVTAELGIKKSDPSFFIEVVKRLRESGFEVIPDEILFFDDSQTKVEAALEAGLNAHLFEDVEGVKQVLLDNKIKV